MPGAVARRRRWPLIAAVAALLWTCVSAHATDAPAAQGPSAKGASWAEVQSGRCLDAIAAAQKAVGTEPGLLVAIARTESGRPVPPLPGLQPWPWAVNADGGAWYFDSKAVAVAWTGLALRRGLRQIDVGCMQVNLQSHPHAFSSLDDAFEPASNALYAARFLQQLRVEAGDWGVATGWYHSRTPLLADDYRARVAAIAAGRLPPASLGVPLYMRAIRQGTLRIALSGGGVLRINTARQPSRRRRHLSACQVAEILGDYIARNARSACGRSTSHQSRR